MSEIIGYTPVKGDVSAETKLLLTMEDIATVAADLVRLHDLHVGRGFPPTGRELATADQITKTVRWLVQSAMRDGHGGMHTTGHVGVAVTRPGTDHPLDHVDVYFHLGGLWGDELARLLEEK